LKLQTGANDAHSDDTRRLKIEVADWLNACNPEFPEETQTSKQLTTKKKEGHGISNDVTGHLLCPISYDWDNPECVDCSHFFTTLFH
jgi:hypothetical protein